jgi:hypothetical protein
MGTPLRRILDDNPEKKLMVYKASLWSCSDAADFYILSEIFPQY